MPRLPLISQRMRRPSPVFLTRSRAVSLSGSRSLSVSAPPLSLLLATLLLASPLALAHTAPNHTVPARAVAPHSAAISFAVVSGLPATNSAVPDARRLLTQISNKSASTPRNPIRFIVHLGNLKGPDEACSDGLYADRYALLNGSALPLLFIPGEYDWVDCARPQAGGADPRERLDALRDVFLGSNYSLGQTTLQLIRESELAAFRPYRENTRWIMDGIVFATLQVPADNNHFEDGGGRNGEFEDREVANHAWINRAVTDARRRQARALVFFMQGDPDFSRESRRERSWWFRHTHRERDGFATLRRDLTNAAKQFNGSVLLINTGAPESDNTASGNSRSGGNSGKPLQSVTLPARARVDRIERIDLPLLTIDPLSRDHAGKALHSLRQIRMPLASAPQQWLRVLIGPGHSEGAAATIRATLFRLQTNGEENRLPERQDNDEPLADITAENDDVASAAAPVTVPSKTAERRGVLPGNRPGNSASDKLPASPENNDPVSSAHAPDHSAVINPVIGPYQDVPFLTPDDTTQTSPAEDMHPPSASGASTPWPVVRQDFAIPNKPAMPAGPAASGIATPGMKPFQ